MKKVLAKNPADGDEIDDARADDDPGPGPVSTYPRYTSDKRPNPTMQRKDLETIMAVAGGQAISDELVEWLAQEYGTGKGVMMHLLLEMGIPVAAGVATRAYMDDNVARSIAIGLIATGTVNGVRIAVQQLKAWWDERSDSGEESSKQMSGRPQLPPAQRRALMQRALARRQREQPTRAARRSSRTLSRDASQTMVAV